MLQLAAVVVVAIVAIRVAVKQTKKNAVRVQQSAITVIRLVLLAPRDGAVVARFVVVQCAWCLCALVARFVV